MPCGSPGKRTSDVSTPSSLSALKYCSDSDIGVRQSSSPVTIRVGVVTFSTTLRSERDS